MRIIWNADNAREIKGSLEDIRSSLERSAGMSDRIHAAFAEANPNGANKRLRLLEESFDVSVRRIRTLMKETEELVRATGTMTRLFDDSEEEALRILKSLEEGTKAGMGAAAGAAKGISTVRPAAGPGRLPIAVPSPVVAPQPRIPVYGPVPVWLRDLANKRTFTITR